MPETMKRLFCPSCQAEVEAVMGRSPTGLSVAKCTVCGTVIQDRPAKSSSRETISLDEVSFVDESISVPTLDTVMVVGYTPSVRQVLVDKMVERHLGREILPLQNGEEMIINIIPRLASPNGKNRVDLVVLDVPMPFLNGINAAIGLRALERTYKDHDLIPILFLTNKPCDDTFRKVIKYLAPSKYATLGPVDDQDKFLKHLQRILSLLAQEKW
jgi:CheY-like chemotaxis protein